MAPEVGLEPTTNRLTADRSTTELLRNWGRASKSCFGVGIKCFCRGLLPGMGFPLRSLSASQI
jgi:hypothetical protein